ncbi:MAG: L,D-transpeptidase family protein [Desulforhopalus sp.]
MATDQKSTLISVFFSTLLVFASLGYSATEPVLRDMLINSLKLGPATSLNLNTHGRSSKEIDNKLIEIYRINGFLPFWIENGQPSRRAKDIYAALMDSSTHGLNPANYLVNNIDHFWDNSDSASKAKLDIILTLGMIRYIADQREGRFLAHQDDTKMFTTARDVEVDWRAVCQAAFKTEDMDTFLAEQAPPFLQYRLLREKLAKYRSIEATGGWPSIPAGPALKPGADDSRITSVRERLAVTGELKTNNLTSEVFDQSLVEAVKIFQKRHNLSIDGILGKQTLAAMNVPVEKRIGQIIINMERYRWLKRQNNKQLVAVNIASFEAAAGRQDHFDISMPVIVGKTYHKTPVFNDNIEYVVFNPYWNVPPSIARNEILPNQQKDPAYLQKSRMRIFQGWKPGAVELDPGAIDWTMVSKKEMDQYHIRQEPGPDNALGTLKIIFPNEYNVYLHDTPAHNLFKQETRALSHGCIRMGRPAEMAAWVLEGEEKGWSVERVNEIVATRKRQVVTLDQQLPVYILYRTAYIRPEDDALYFYDDIYGRDNLLAQALEVANH